MVGIRRANGFDDDDELATIPRDELRVLRRDSQLVAIMRAMGAFDREGFDARPGAIYWPGTEQAFDILSDYSD
jgi:hypothetical protein